MEGGAGGRGRAKEDPRGTGDIAEAERGRERAGRRAR